MNFIPPVYRFLWMGLSATYRLPSSIRGRDYVSPAGSMHNQRLPEDSIGTMTVTLTNVVVGSAIRIETQAGALIEFRTATGSTEVFSVPAYSHSNPSNDLRIKVRKGSASPYYRPLETLATAFVGSASIYVAQIQDD